MLRGRGRQGYSSLQDKRLCFAFIGHVNLNFFVHYRMPKPCCVASSLVASRNSFGCRQSLSTEASAGEVMLPVKM